MEFLYLLEGIRNNYLDILFSVITSFGEEIVLVGIFAICYWCINKTLAYKLGFTYFISGAAVQTVKMACRIPRPWIKDPGFHPVESALDNATGYSFPSAHTQSSTSLYGGIAFHFAQPRIYILSYVIIGLVMLSRMYLGCHTPADVLVGFAITFVIAFIVHYIYKNYNSTPVTDALCVAFMLIISIASAVYSFYLVKNQIVTEALSLDAFKSAGAGIGFGIGWYIEKNHIKFNPKVGSFPLQILKVIIGLLVALVIKSGIKMLFGDSIPVAMIRYFLVVVWVVAVYPYIIKKIYTGKTNESKTRFPL